MEDIFLPVPQRRKCKGIRGQPLIYDEIKKPRSISLTNTAITIADQFCQEFGLLSRGDAIEVLLRVSMAIPRGTLHQAIRQTFDPAERENPQTEFDQ